MKSLINSRKVDNIIRSFHTLAVIAAFPVLSYLALNHKEQSQEKTGIVYQLKSVTPTTHSHS